MTIRRTATSTVLAALAAGGLLLAPATVAFAQQPESRLSEPAPGMARMHELHSAGNPGMARMHELHTAGNPGMTQMHEQMVRGPR